MGFKSRAVIPLPAYLLLLFCLAVAAAVGGREQRSARARGQKEKLIPLLCVHICLWNQSDQHLPRQARVKYERRRFDSETTVAFFAHL